MTEPTDINDDDALAGELALRVLSPEAEAEARRREANDPAFAVEVEAWNAHLATFAAEIDPVEPSSGVWPRIAAGIAIPANDNARVTFWRRWAVGSTGLLAASVAAMAILLMQPAPSPVMVPVPAAGGVMRVATLSLDNGVSAMTIAYDSVSGALYLAPTHEMAGDTRVPHLWLVMPEGGVQLVGAIDGTATSRHNLTGALSGMAGQAAAVAVSMEAPGHTPGAAKPDGPVVASGELQQL
ncbi:anti-sigma factor [uncultured Brevundimonas sp.]|uniref:anti-sigma factor n=1 Tax=uncultured Brevundimonas sp. TaxID=213418 RepID=UPI0030EE214E|tara:strand:+ start:1591 stop:2310 length:720 start_codon:yes stop_codon:yes gene_type:complete